MKAEIELCYFSSKEDLADYAMSECMLPVKMDVPLMPSPFSFTIPLIKKSSHYELDLLLKKPVPIGNILSYVHEANSVIYHVKKTSELLSETHEKHQINHTSHYLSDSRRIEYLREPAAYLHELSLDSLVEFQSAESVSSCKINLVITNNSSTDTQEDVRKQFIGITNKFPELFVLTHSITIDDMQIYYLDAVFSQLAFNFLKKKPKYAEQLDKTTFRLYHTNYVRFKS
jgi:hypothetical protein